ncbi:MAG: hypothetical protein KAR13_15805, partial [Desulfobulbaceae bacterium]|nr:hypothetical protein [Desulfobulbaceae bacterium]
IVEVRLLPTGSKLFWTDDRIEKMIADFAEKPKEQVKSEGRPEDINFGRYIKEWALQYGFSAEEVKREIDKWIAEVNEKGNDFYKLGLAAFANKNFSKAVELFQNSADLKEKQLQEIRQKKQELEKRERLLIEEIIRDYFLKGGVYYNDYQFHNALDAYQKTKGWFSREEYTRLWAFILTNIGNTQLQIGLRVKGNDIKGHLSEAVKVFRQTLEVYTRTDLPQDWARTQNNLGSAFHEQGIRAGGSEGGRLLGQAVEAYRNALYVYTRTDLPQDWARTQYNLGAALSNQSSIRAGDSEGGRLLGQAVEAYRNALYVYTRTDLPQDWARTQNNLGSAFHEQGIRAGGSESERLLGQAVKAYRNALEV